MYLCVPCTYPSVYHTINIGGLEGRSLAKRSQDAENTRISVKPQSTAKRPQACCQSPTITFVPKRRKHPSPLSLRGAYLPLFNPANDQTERHLSIYRYYTSTLARLPNLIVVLFLCVRSSEWLAICMHHVLLHIGAARLVCAQG